MFTPAERDHLDTLADRLEAGDHGCFVPHGTASEIGTSPNWSPAIPSDADLRWSKATTRGFAMGWFKRWRNKMRNYTSGGDYAGSHSRGGGSESTSHANARAESEMVRFKDTTGPGNS